MTPWQIELLGHLSEVSSLDELEDEFENLAVLNMTETREYANDTYGQRTLDERGGLFLHEVADVAHGCWIYDTTAASDGVDCSWDAIYDQHVYTLLQ